MPISRRSRSRRPRRKEPPSRTIGLLVDTSRSQRGVMKPERKASYVFPLKFYRPGLAARATAHQHGEAPCIVWRARPAAPISVALYNFRLQFHKYGNVGFDAGIKNFFRDSGQ